MKVYVAITIGCALSIDISASLDCLQTTENKNCIVIFVMLLCIRNMIRNIFFTAFSEIPTKPNGAIIRKLRFN